MMSFLKRYGVLIFLIFCFISCAVCSVITFDLLETQYQPIIDAGFNDSIACGMLVIISFVLFIACVSFIGSIARQIYILRKSSAPAVDYISHTNDKE